MITSAKIHEISLIFYYIFNTIQTSYIELNIKRISELMAVDHNLTELLTEYRNLAESDQENQNFIGSIINKPENAAVIFGALSQFEVIYRIS